MFQNGQGNGLDNTPNQDWNGWGQAANDMSIQQVQAAHYLVRILEEILAKDETLTPADPDKIPGDERNTRERKRI